MKELFFVYAGNERQAQIWRYEHGLTPTMAPSIANIEFIRGRHGCKYVCVGTYYERKDWLDIRVLFSAMDFKEIGEVTVLKEIRASA